VKNEKGEKSQLEGKEKEELTQDALMEIFQKKATYSDVM